MSQGEIRPHTAWLFSAGLALVLLAGLAVRIPALPIASASYRLGEAFNGEEVENVRISTGMLHRQSLNPHAFEYPSLFYDASLAVESALARLGHRDWSDYLLGVRSLSLAFGIGTILLVALMARSIAGDAAGILAATIVAFDGTLIDISTIAKPNAAQLFFLVAAFLVLIAPARRFGVGRACAAAALLALAAASKWLGALGLAGLALAPMLTIQSEAPAGWPRFRDALIQGVSRPRAVWKLLLPPMTFGAVFVACVPYSVLSPREFVFGLAQTVTAQSLHRRNLPFWAPAGFLAHSIGPAAAVMAALALLWAARRLLRWDGGAHDRGVLMVSGWVLCYGALAMCVFVRLAGYVDLWVPFIAVLTGCAIVGSRGLIRKPAWAAVVIAAAFVSGAISHGADALAEARSAAHFDTRTAAGNWLAAHASDSDQVLADQGAYIPDRLSAVNWNSWGSPPRVVYDESATWGTDPAWPDWPGGHRRLIFENIKWQKASHWLAARPRWVVVSEDWRQVRTHPQIASEFGDPDYDRGLEDGSAGYVIRARFTAAGFPGSWRLLGLSRDAERSGVCYRGPDLTVFERVR